MVKSSKNFKANPDANVPGSSNNDIPTVPGLGGSGSGETGDGQTKVASKPKLTKIQPDLPVLSESSETEDN